jgi:two-component system KDP operon response regulator KdpE
VLVIEDEVAIAEVVARALVARGFTVRIALDGRSGLDATAFEEPDVVILDLGLPDIDGIDVCRRIRTWSQNPIIVLSADGAEDRKIAALDEGADDYVTKPFSMPELLARVRVAVRYRRLLARAIDSALLTLGDVVIDTGSRDVRVAGESIDLTRIEFDLLELFARNPGKVLTQRMIVDQVWEHPKASTAKSLRVHVLYLRRKLGEGARRVQIVTEPGVGYRLVLPDPTG